MTLTRSCANTYTTMSKYSPRRAIRVRRNPAYTYGLRSRSEPIPDGAERHSDPTGQFLFGFASYAEPLSEADLKRYELTPVFGSPAAAVASYLAHAKTNRVKIARQLRDYVKSDADVIRLINDNGGEFLRTYRYWPFGQYFAEDVLDALRRQVALIEIPPVVRRNPPFFEDADDRERIFKMWLMVSADSPEQLRAIDVPRVMQESVGPHGAFAEEFRRWLLSQPLQKPTAAVVRAYVIDSSSMPDLSKPAPRAPRPKAGRLTTHAAPWPIDIVNATGRAASGRWRFERSDRPNDRGRASCDLDAVDSTATLRPGSNGALFVIEFDPLPGQRIIRIAVSHDTPGTLRVVLQHNIAYGRDEWGDIGSAPFDPHSGHFLDTAILDHNREDPLRKIPRLTLCGIADAIRRAIGPRAYAPVTATKQLATTGRRIEFVLRCIGAGVAADGGDFGRWIDKGKRGESSRENLYRTVVSLADSARKESERSGGRVGHELPNALTAFAAAVEATSASEMKAALVLAESELAPMIESLRLAALAAYRIEE